MADSNEKLPPLDMAEPLLSFIQPWLEEATKDLDDNQTRRVYAKVCAHSLQIYKKHLDAGMDEYYAALEAQIALGPPDATRFTWPPKVEVLKPGQTLEEWLAIAVIGPDTDVSRRFRDEITEHYDVLCEEFRAEGLDTFAASEKAVRKLGSPEEARRQFKKMSSAAGHPILNELELHTLSDITSPWRWWVRLFWISLGFLHVHNLYHHVSTIQPELSDPTFVRLVFNLWPILLWGIPSALNGRLPTSALLSKCAAHPILLAGVFLIYGDVVEAWRIPGSMVSFGSWGFSFGTLTSLLLYAPLLRKLHRMSKSDFAYWVPLARQVAKD